MSNKQLDISIFFVKIFFLFVITSFSCSLTLFHLIDILLLLIFCLLMCVCMYKHDFCVRVFANIHCVQFYSDLLP